MLAQLETSLGIHFLLSSRVLEKSVSKVTASLVLLTWSSFSPLALQLQTEALKEENDSLRCQLDAYRNEVELLKQEQGKLGREEDAGKDQQLELLQQALQGMQQVGGGEEAAMLASVEEWSPSVAQGINAVA